jgi:Kef-type K+ transport system membrane component KefB
MRENPAAPAAEPQAAQANTARRVRATAVYVLMIVAAAGLTWLVCHYGATLAPPTPPAATPGSAGTDRPQHAGVFVHLLVALAAVLITGRLLARLFVYLGQPPVIGEVVAGIVLGPSLLGRVWPEAYAFLLPSSVAAPLGLVAQLGVVLYMFLVGLELDAGRLRARAHASVAISHASIVAPFLLGVGLALPLYPRLAPAGVPFTSFALFLGVALSVTAFPVLARILTDRGLARTELGLVALGCAAADDVTAWCLLAFVVGVAQARPEAALLVGGLALAYLAFMVLVVRPVAVRLARRWDDGAVDRGVVAGVLAALLLSTLATEAIGLHAVFGAFLLGAVIPHDSALARALTRRLEDVATVLLLPAFFAYTGMRTQIGLVSSGADWLACGIILLAATAGKFGGTLVAGRVTGLGWRTSAALGVLMNTRGLMELIVLNVGLDLGVISPALFAMMVLMAVVTTMATGPLLALLTSPGQRGAGPGAPVRPRGARTEGVVEHA